MDINLLVMNIFLVSCLERLKWFYGFYIRGERYYQDRIGGVVNSFLLLLSHIQVCHTSTRIPYFLCGKVMELLTGGRNLFNNYRALPVPSLPRPNRENDRANFWANAGILRDNILFPLLRDIWVRQLTQNIFST